MSNSYIDNYGNITTIPSVGSGTTYTFNNNVDPPTLWVIPDPFTITNTITGNQIAIITQNGIPAPINETITDFGTPVVNTSNPNNIAVTLPYNQEGGTVDNVNFNIPIPNPVSVVNSIDLKVGTNPNELVVEIVYTDDNGNPQTITDTTPYDLSNLESPWDDLGTNNPADQSSGNIQYTSGNVTVGSGGSTLGTQSTFQSLSDQNGEEFIQAPWVYTQAIEAFDEKGATSTAIILGLDGNYNTATDTISIVTNGDRHLTVQANGQLRLDDYGATAFNDNSPFKILGVQTDGDVVQVDASTLDTNTQNTVTAGANVTVTPTTNPNGTINYEVGSIGQPDTNTQASVISSDGSISVDATGTNADGETEYDISVDYTAIIETEERSRVLGYANVNADGTLADVFGGATVTVDQTGRRLLVPPTGAESTSTTVVESFTTRDSIDSRLEDFIGQAIHITEGDNGTAANVPVNRAFTIQWYGKEEVITGLQATTNQIIVPTNTSDLTNDSNFITLADLPPDSDDQTLTLTKEFVDKSYYAVGYLSPTDIHDNGSVVNFASVELDAGWTRVGNTYSYTGSPKAVRVDANIIAEDVGVSNYWAKPRLRITETVSGRIWNFSDLTMQDTGAYDGTSVIDGSLTHVNPPTNPSYLLEWFDEDTRTATIIPTADSMIGFVANDPIQVLTDVTIS